jgi:tRNA(fMet)-specific endonuclease VapC
MGVLIDTNVIIDVEREGLDIMSFVRDRTEEEFFLSVISASEMLHGMHRAQDSGVRARRLAFVEAVLSAFPVLDIDLSTARIHAELWSHLAGEGMMIGLHDSWLAATCLTHNLILVTRNKRDFARITGLKFEIW